MSQLENLRWLAPEQVSKLADKFDTPIFVYSEHVLREQARTMLNLNVPHGLTIRYAMKANPNRSILKIFASQDIGIDAGSEYEAQRAMLAGIKPGNILITSQEFPSNMKKLVRSGVKFDAGSLHQLEIFGRLFPSGELGLRINPGIGSGHSRKVATGGVASSFGIWHEQIEQAADIAAKHKLKIVRIHIHIGAGTDVAKWQDAGEFAMDIVKRFPRVETLNMGGGYQVARTYDEEETHPQVIINPLVDMITEFYNTTGRKIRLELEPGTWLIANAGSLICRVQDIVTTGDAGYIFIKLDGGLTEFVRPIFYGSQHPIIVVGELKDTGHFAVVGHTCESSDLLTVDPDRPEFIKTRKLNRPRIGDYVVIEGAGAYGAAMNFANYVSYPQAAEVLWRENGKPKLIRKRQKLYQITANER